MSECSLHAVQHPLGQIPDRYRRTGALDVCWLHEREDAVLREKGVIREHATAIGRKRLGLCEHAAHPHLVSISKCCGTVGNGEYFRARLPFYHLNRETLICLPHIGIGDDSAGERYGGTKERRKRAR